MIFLLIRSSLTFETNKTINKCHFWWYNNSFKCQSTLHYETQPTVLDLIGLEFVLTLNRIRLNNNRDSGVKDWKTGNIFDS